MNLQILLFLQLFLTTHSFLRPHKFILNENQPQPKKHRDVAFMDSDYSSESLADIEYDLDGDFEFNLNKLRELNGMGRDSSEDHSRFEKSIPFEPPSPLTPHSLILPALQMKIDQPSPPPPQGVGMKWRVTSHALNYLKEKLVQLLTHDSVRHRPEGITTDYLGMNISIENMRITDFQPPEINLEKLPDNTVRISSSGGRAKILGSYVAIYRTKREGQMETFFSGLQTDFKLKYLKTFDGKLKIIDHSCSFNVVSVNVSLSPELAVGIPQHIQRVLRTRMVGNMCSGIEKYVLHASELMGNIASFVNPLEAQANNFKKDVRFDGRTVSDPLVTELYTEIGLRGEFVSNRTVNEERPKELQTSDSDVSRMSYVYISDFTFNTFFNQLSTYGDVLFNLHVLPEIADFLRIRCAEFESCIGRYARLEGVEAESGRLVLRTRSGPSVRFVEGAALIGLSVSVGISYRTSYSPLDIHQRFLKFDADILLRVSKLQIVVQEKKYIWKAKVDIEKIKTSNEVALRPEMKTFVENLEQILNKSRHHIESLLSTHLRSVVPVQVSTHLHFTNIETEFRPNTLLLGFDVSLDSRLFPHLNLIR